MTGISTGTLSGAAATTAIALSGTYYKYILDFDLEQSGGDQKMILQVSTDGGANWQIGGYTWGWLKADDDSTGNNPEGIGSSVYGGTDGIYLGRIGSGTGERMIGTITIVRPDVSSRRRVTWEVASGADGSDRIYVGAGTNNSSAFNAVRLKSTSGNVTGTWNLTGVEYGSAPAPVANDDTDTATKNTQKTITFNALKANDTLNGATAIASVGSESNCTVSLDGNGDVTFTPATDFTGSASFAYTLTNSAGSDSATVTVTVSEGGGGTWYTPISTDWTDKSGNLTFGTGTMNGSGEGSARVVSGKVFTGDFEVEVTIGSVGASLGVYKTTQDGSYSSAPNHGNMDAMGSGNSLFFNKGDNSVKTGSSVLASGLTQASGDVWKLARVSGVVTIYRDSGGGFQAQHTGQSISGDVRLVLGAGAGTTSLTGIRWK